MSTVISRRSFLKCTGASAAALGAVSLLGGCKTNGDDTVVDVVLHLIGVGQVIGVQHHAVALSRAAQQVIAGHIIVIRYPDNKVQTALADALFVVGEQCLGHPKILRGLLLGDAALLAQQLDDTVEFHDFGLLSSGN